MKINEVHQPTRTDSLAEAKSLCSELKSTLTEMSRLTERLAEVTGFNSGMTMMAGFITAADLPVPPGFAPYLRTPAHRHLSAVPAEGNSR